MFASGTLDLYARVNVNLNGGNNRIAVPNGTLEHRWIVDGNNSGRIENGVQSIAFQSVQTLIGGTGADEFRFEGSGTVDGHIYGQGGTDELNYSNYNSKVNVNLKDLHATGVGNNVNGRVHGIEDLRGSRFGDMLKVAMKPTGSGAGTDRLDLRKGWKRSPVW